MLTNYSRFYVLCLKEIGNNLVSLEMADNGWYSLEFKPSAQTEKFFQFMKQASEELKEEFFDVPFMSVTAFGVEIPAALIVELITRMDSSYLPHFDELENPEEDNSDGQHSNKNEDNLDDLLDNALDEMDNQPDLETILNSTLDEFDKQANLVEMLDSTLDEFENPLNLDELLSSTLDEMDGMDALLEAALDDTEQEEQLKHSPITNQTDLIKVIKKQDFCFFNGEQSKTMQKIRENINAFRQANNGITKGFFIQKTTPSTKRRNPLELACENILLLDQIDLATNSAEKSSLENLSVAFKQLSAILLERKMYSFALDFAELSALYEVATSPTKNFEGVSYLSKTLLRVCNTALEQEEQKIRAEAQSNPMAAMRGNCTIQ